MPEKTTAQYEWVTLKVERALYVDEGRDIILCDRLPGPVTLVLKIRKDQIPELIVPRCAESFESLLEEAAHA